MITDEQYIKAAQEKVRRYDDLVEIDETLGDPSCMVSRGSDPGVYVRAWVWVYANEAAENRDQLCSFCTENERLEGEKLCEECKAAGRDEEYVGPTKCGDCNSEYGEGMQLGIVCPCCQRGVLVKDAD